MASCLRASTSGIALGGGGAMFVNGTFGFEAALAGVAGLLFVNLVIPFLREPEECSAGGAPADRTAAGKSVR